jgi:hypothetical protein
MVGEGGNITHGIDEKRYRILVAKPGGSRQLWRLKSRRKNNNKMDLNEAGYLGADRIHM